MRFHRVLLVAAGLLLGAAPALAGSSQDAALAKLVEQYDASRALMREQLLRFTGRMPQDPTMQMLYGRYQASGGGLTFAEWLAGVLPSPNWDDAPPSHPFDGPIPKAKTQTPALADLYSSDMGRTSVWFVYDPRTGEYAPYPSSGERLHPGP